MTKSFKKMVTERSIGNDPILNEQSSYLDRDRELTDLAKNDRQEAESLRNTNGQLNQEQQNLLQKNKEIAAQKELNDMLAQDQEKKATEKETEAADITAIKTALSAVMDPNSDGGTKITANELKSNKNYLDAVLSILNALEPAAWKLIINKNPDIKNFIAGLPAQRPETPVA